MANSGIATAGLGRPYGLVQVFLNLARNSQRAMQRFETKRLRVSASDEGSTVVIRFEDTGVGMRGSGCVSAFEL
jgi:signal transduction histidine kinase